MEDAITVSALKKYFGDFPAVDNIGFEVRRGEIFGFLGPNGAGKTTTQRMLTGIIKATTGIINIMGYDLMKDPFKAKMLMGVVPEMANPYIDLSAWNNLMLMGQLYGLDKKNQQLPLSPPGKRSAEPWNAWSRPRPLLRPLSRGIS